MKTCVIMPAYNAGKVVASVIERIPAGVIDEIIVVGVASRRKLRLWRLADYTP
jgi:glycosyltransferase involved in cell wall biosynthesis